MTIAWLEEKRNLKNMTHEAVANDAQIDRSYYTKIENGAMTPSVRVAKRIAKVLGFDWTLFFNQNCDDAAQKHKIIEPINH